MDKIVKQMVDQRLARGLPDADDEEMAEEYEALLYSDDRKLSSFIMWESTPH